MITNLKIVFQNVLSWTVDRRNELSNYYNRTGADVIILNSTGIKDTENIKIFNYNVYQRNFMNELHAGVAIAVKRGIHHQLIDDFADDVLAIRLESTKGPFIITTLYSPPRRNYLPIGELNRLMDKNIPVYLLGDLNAQH